MKRWSWFSLYSGDADFKKKVASLIPKIKMPFNVN
jgi:hypothetical protein